MTFNQFFTGPNDHNAPFRRVVSEARAKPGFQLVMIKGLRILDGYDKIIKQFTEQSCVQEDFDRSKTEYE
jgi:hypothetical protein